MLYLNEYCVFIKVSWTHALRQIVINCYKYHGREDLLPAFSEDEDKNTNSNQTKEKVKSRSSHASINVTGNSNVATVSSLTADTTATLAAAAQGVNVRLLFFTLQHI